MSIYIILKWVKSRVGKYRIGILSCTLNESSFYVFSNEILQAHLNLV